MKEMSFDNATKRGDGSSLAVLIGSLNTIRSYPSLLKRLKETLRSNGIEVICPVEVNDNLRALEKNLNLYNVQRQYLDFLDKADFVIAIPKNDGTFGESTTYELAYARKNLKPVLILSNEKLISKMLNPMDFA